MKIAICDDEQYVLEQLYKLVTDYYSKNNMFCKVSCFRTFGEFFEVQSEYDLVFLDYSIPPENGIEFAKKLREVNKSIFIIFQTSFREHVFESFSLDTFRYLLKPIKEEEVISALDAFVSIFQRERKVVIPTSEKTIFVDADQVMYIEADRKYSVVRTTSGFFKTNKGISVYESEINNSAFFRTHRSYIVNMRYVSAVEKKVIILSNGEKIIVSAKLYDEFLRNYMSYLKYKK